MKRFITKIIFSCFSILVIAFVLLLLSSYAVKDKVKNKGRASVIDKTKMLANTASPRIILIGGSNICYGMSTALLQDSLHIPIIDMSINARVGMCFYMNQLKPYLQKNDIVIAIPEYAAFSTTDYYGDQSMYALGVIDKKNCNILTTYQWLRLPLFIGDLLKDNYTTYFSEIKEETAEVTRGRYLYNRFGDYEGHRNKPSQINEKQIESDELDYNIVSNQNIQSSIIDGLRDFSNYCIEKEVRFFISHPVYAKALFNKEYADKIESSLKELHWINGPEKYIYHYSELYDSPNHLIFAMRDERTLKLLTDIKQHIMVNAPIR